MMNRGVAAIAIAIAGFALDACSDSGSAADGGVALDAQDVPADRPQDNLGERPIDGVFDFGLPDLVDGLPDDRPPLPGVSCVTRQRVLRDGSCTQDTTTEPDVGFRLTLANLEAHNESALATDSVGIHLYFGNSSVSQGPLFITTDATYTLYRASETVPGMDTGTGRRTGARLDFTMNAARGDVVPGGCQFPLLEIACSGSTWLRP